MSLDGPFLHVPLGISVMKSVLKSVKRAVGMGFVGYSPWLGNAEPARHAAPCK